MLFSQRQPLKTRQNNITLLSFACDGTVATPLPAGLDSKFIKTVVKNSAGNYTITLKDSARRNLVVESLNCLTDGLYGRILATTPNSFTVVFKTFAGVATDAQFNAKILYHEDATLY